MTHSPAERFAPATLPQPRQPTSPHPGPDPTSAPPACLAFVLAGLYTFLLRFTAHFPLCPSFSLFFTLSSGTGLQSQKKNTEGHSFDSPVCILKHKDLGRKIMTALFMSLREAASVLSAKTICLLFSFVCFLVQLPDLNKRIGPRKRML